MKHNSAYSQVLVIGSIAFDEIMDFPHAFQDYIDPTKLHQINVSFVVDRLEKQMGGTATNIAYNLHLLLENNTNIIPISAVGKDGGQFLEWLKAKNIETKGVFVDKNLYTASGKVITDIKDNQIWGFYYGALQNSKNIDLRSIASKNALAILSATHPEAFYHFQTQVISLGLDYLYDPGMTLTWIKPEELKKGVEHCTWLAGNDYEIGRMYTTLGTNAETLLKKNIGIITTLGEKGVRYQDKNHDILIPVYKTNKIVDPTGAGDAWRAGFIGGMLEKKSIEESLKLGNALASFAIETYGTVQHVPSKNQIKKRAELL